MDIEKVLHECFCGDVSSIVPLTSQAAAAVKLTVGIFVGNIVPTGIASIVVPLIELTLELFALIDSATLFPKHTE